MLGHLVAFAYCRSTSGDTPCRKLADCWFQRFPVEEYIRTYFPDQFNADAVSQKGRLMTILEIVKRLQDE